MKRKCKHINIEDPEVVKPWVTECILRHKKRYDFKKLLIHFGVKKTDYFAALDSHDYSVFEPAIDRISRDACRRIKQRDLDLPPVRIEQKRDHTTGKLRLIGCESPMQQIFDYIAVFSCEDIWKSRLVPQQASSLPGRGQVYGMRIIRKYVRADNRAIRYARKHGIRYTSKCRYVTKTDVMLCYPSADMDVFMRLFEHDCGNRTIIWLWRSLLMTHKVNGYTGFMIGALVSQWACQFMLSFIYRKAMSIKYVKHGKEYKAINSMLVFMDDMGMFASNRRQLLKAIRIIEAYAKDTLHFTFKPNYAIHTFRQIDMMGYVVYRKGTVGMRARNYVKSRRLRLRYERRHYLTFRQAKRLVSYKGFYKYSDYNKGRMTEVFRFAQKVISKEEKHAKDTILRAA